MKFEYFTKKTLTQEGPDLNLVSLIREISDNVVQMLEKFYPNLRQITYVRCGDHSTDFKSSMFALIIMELVSLECSLKDLTAKIMYPLN